MISINSVDTGGLNGYVGVVKKDKMAQLAAQIHSNDHYFVIIIAWPVRSLYNGRFFPTHPPPSLEL
jgi:hypothetical protein